MAAIELFLAEGAHAAAGVKQTLINRARRQAGLRVNDRCFMFIEHAMGVPNGLLQARAYLHSFVVVGPVLINRRGAAQECNATER